MSYKRTQALMCGPVAPEQANRLLEYNTFPGQRAMQQWKANLYAGLMLNGGMRPVDIDIVTMPNGIKYMMNGQHVCSGIVLTGKPHEARLQYWKCDTETDAWHLFGTFDVHGTRTERQIIKAARPFLGPELHDVSLQVLQACGSALMMASTKPPSFTGVKTCKTAKADLIKPNADIVTWVAHLESVAGKERRSILRVPAVCAMVATYRKNPIKAEEFWNGVCSGELLTRDMPQFRLANTLMTGTTEQNTIGGGSRNKVFYCVCIAYWNSFIEGTKRKSVKVGAMKTIPEPLG